MKTHLTHLFGVSLTASLLAATGVSHAADGTWTNPLGGSWPDTANWLGGTVATGQDGIANFSTLDLGTDTYVTLDGARTIGNLVFGDLSPDYNWFLSTGSGGSLTLDVASGSPNINVVNQTATLGVSLAGTKGFSKLGVGTLILSQSNTYSGATFVSAGTLQVGDIGLPATVGAGAVTNLAALTFYRDIGSLTTITNAFYGNGTLTLAGPPGGSTQGHFAVSGNNTNFTGVINLSNARLEPSTGGVLNYGNPSMINVPSGSSLAASFSTKSTFTQPLSLAGIGWTESAGNLGALRLQGGSAWAGPITLTADARIGLWFAAVGAIQGSVSGSYELEFWAGGGTSAGYVTNAATANTTAATRLSGSLLNVLAGSSTAFSPGPLNMNGGNLRLNGFGATFANLNGATGGTIQNGSGTPSTLTVGTDGTSTSFNGNLLNGSTAPLNVVKAGIGTLTLTGTNSSPTTVSAGTLAVTEAGALTGTLLTVNAGATLDVSGLWVPPYLLSASQTLAGSGTVNGTLVTAAGATVAPGLSAGTLTFNNDLTLAGSTLSFELAATHTAGGGVNDLIQLNGGTLTLSGVNSVFLSGPLADGTYTLIQGFSTLIGDASNLRVGNALRATYTFDTSVPGKILLTVAGYPATPASLVWSGANGNVWDVGITTNWLNGASPDAFFSSDAVAFTDAGTSFNVSLVGTLLPSVVTVNASPSYTFSGAGKISGPTGIAKSGSGTLTLGTTNDFGGGVAITGGTVKAGVHPQLPLGASVVVSPGAAFDFNGFGNTTTRNYGFTLGGNGPDGNGALVNSGANISGNASVSNVTLTADTTISAANRFDIGTGAANMWLNGGGYSLIKTGASEINIRVQSFSNVAGVFVTSGTVKYENFDYVDALTATTTNYVNPGAVLASYGARTYNFPVVFRGGNLDNQNSTVAWTGPLLLRSNATLQASSANPIILGGVISGPGNLTKATTSTLTLTNANTYTGNTFINAGTLALGASGSIAGSPLISLASGTTFNPSAAGTYTIASGRTISGGGSTAGTLVGNFVLEPGASLNPGGTGVFGTLAVSTNLTLNGGTAYFDLGRALTVGGGANDLLQVGTNLSLNGTVTLVISGFPTNGTYTIITNVSGTRSGSGSFVLVNNTRATLTLDTSSAKRVTVTATQGSPLNLVWQGDGTANLWDVGGAANWLDVATPSTFLQGDVVIFSDAGSQTPAVNLTQGVQPTTVVVTNETGSYTLGGVGSLQGAATLIKGGAGSLVLLNNQGNTGPTYINGGTVQAGVGGTTGALGSGAITNQGALTYFRSDAAVVAIANVLAGSGSLNLNGTGAAVQSQYSLTAVNSGFTGTINLSLARLQNGTDATRFGNPSMINVPAGSGIFCATASTFNQPVSLAGQGWLETSAPGRLGAIRFSASTWSGPITLTGDARLAAHGTSGTVSGPLSGAYELEIAGTSGASTFSLNSSANSTAGTRLSNFGTSLIATMNNAAALSTGPLWLNAGSTLRLNGTSPSFASLNGTNGTVANNHASTAATLTVGADNSNTTFGGTLVNGSTAALNLIKAGTGTLTLNNTVSYSGATTVNAGRLTFLGAAMPTNSATITLASGAVIDVSALPAPVTLGLLRTQTLAGAGAVVGDMSDAPNSALVYPGGIGAIGTLTFSNNLTLAGGSWTYDLTSVTTPGGTFNDLANVRGDLVLADGSTTYFNVSLTSLTSPGTYRLVTWQGTRTGSGAVATGTLPGIAASLVVNDAGKSIDLVVADVPALKWSGATDNEWETAGAKVNWLDGAAPTTWVLNKKARFDDSGNNTSVLVSQDPQAAGITVSNLTKNYAFTGVVGITGGASLTKQGAARLTIANPFNAWTGGTLLQEGTLQVGDGATDGSLPALVQNSAALIFNTLGAVSHAGGITGTGTLAKVGSGALTLTGDNSGFSGPTTISQGEVSVQSSQGLGSGLVTVGSAATAPTDVTLLTLGTGATIANSLVVETNALDATITGDGAITGPATLTKKGVGILKVSSKNTYTGATVISGGTLQLDTTNALAAGTTIFLGDTNSGTDPVTFRIGPSQAAGTVGAASPIVVSSNAPLAKAYIDNNSASTAVAVNSGTITLQNHDFWITNSGSVILQLNGQITGTGNLYIATGTYGRRVRLNYNGNNFVGDVYILSGGPQTGNGVANSSSDAIPNNADVFMSAGTKLGLGASDTFGGLNGGAADPVNGIVAAIVNPNISGAGAQILTLGNNNHNATYDGDMDNEGATHVLRLTKIGTGRQTLNGVCSFTGQTLVNGGELRVNGNYASTNVTVASGAILSGTGTLNGVASIQAGGTLSPGASVGTLTVFNNLSLAGNLFIELDKALSPASDQVFVTGTLANTGFGTITVTNLNPGLPLGVGDTFTLFSAPLPGGRRLVITPAPGPGLAWANRLETDGTIAVISLTPTTLTATVNGANLDLTWPAEPAWALEVQTNPLEVGVSTNWVRVPNSHTNNSYSVPLNPATPTLFYRLTYP
jgi:fibronectin-binding autotransporter adhesin